MKALFSLLGSLGGIIDKLLGRSEREEFREAGRNEERLQQFEDVEDAKQREEDVERPTRANAIKRLRKHGL